MTTETNSQLLELPPKTNELKRIIRVLFSRWITVFGIVIILLTIIAAVFAPQLAPYDPNTPSLRNVLAGPSSTHLLGTDAMGRDTLSRIIYGARIALMVGLLATGIAAGIGLVLGLVAGYFGKWTNIIIMRFIDSLMAFPVIILALLLSILLGGGLVNVMIAVGVAMSALYARVMCGVVLTIKENDYILNLRSLGASSFRIMVYHILRNAFPPIIVLITINMGAAILAEAGLSYLGLGIEIPTAAWGSMVRTGYQYLVSAPALALAPGVAIMLVVFAFNMLGDGLRDALDPRLRGLL